MNNYLTLSIIISALLIAFGCKEKSMEPVKSSSFYVGTYTDGESEGIYKYELLENGTIEHIGLMAATENPSFLAKSKDGKYLLAVNEVSDENQVGYVSSFKIESDTLLPFDQKSSGGAHPCHITTNAGGFVLVANYSGGNMGLLQIQEDGSLSELLDVQQHEGKGSTSRQEGPHAHSSWFTKEGSVISVDLGTNQLWFSEIDETNNLFIPGEPATFTMEEGAGPRHLVFHPEQAWIYVVNELTSSISLLIWDAAAKNYEIEQTISTLPSDYTDYNTCADIHVSADGKYVYASNRGHNSIAIFSVDPKTGALEVQDQVPTRGETPRNFTLSPDGNFLLVANQTTNNIVSFKRDQETGMLTFVHQIGAPSPVCLLF